MDEKITRLTFKEGSLITDEKGEITGGTFELSPRNYLLFSLSQLSLDPKLPEDDKLEILETYRYLSAYLGGIEISLNDIKGVDIKYKYIREEDETDEVKDKLTQYFNSKYIREILSIMARDLRKAIYLAEREAKAKQKTKEKLRSGGHLIDNILKSNKPKEKQLSIFDTMLQDTRSKVLSVGTTVEMVNRKGEGIKLSKGEYKLLLCLQKLLHEKSQTEDPKKDDYYSGNQGSDIINYTTPQGDVRLRSPKVSFTFYEIAKDYYGGGEIGGENIKVVAKLLSDIADDPEKKALIRYHKVVDMGKGKEREYFIERYDSLISIATAGYKDILHGKQIDEKREIVINLHPIFIDQIATKYIELPLDITKRMIEANGSNNISEITQKLIYELARAYSNRRRLSKDEDKNPLYTIGQMTLYYKIAESYLPPYKKRLPLIEKYLAQAIETAKTIGLLQSYKTEPGATGELNYIFTLSKNWE